MPSSYRPPGGYDRVTLAQIAREIDRTPHQTAKLLARLSFIGLKPRRGDPTRTITFDAQAIEAVKALLGQPHRKTDCSQKDWLSDFIGGATHA